MSLNANNVIVVTNPELGWDCVVGVFADAEALRNSWIFEDEEGQRGPEGRHRLLRALNAKGMVIHSAELETATLIK